MINIKCKLDNSINAQDIANILPKWKTDITEAKIIEELGLPQLRLKFAVAAVTADDVRRWLKEFQHITKTTYSVRVTQKIAAVKVAFKQRLHCQHNTKCKRLYDPSLRNKTRNTNCPSKISITLRVIKENSRSKNPPNAKLPCEVVLYATHNHSTESLDALKFRRIADETKEKLIKLFENGHTAATALQSIKMDIQMNHENYETIMGDRKYCPDYRDCLYLHSLFKKNSVPFEFDSKGKEFLLKRLEEYNKEMNDDSAARMEFDENHYVICICPPMLRRIHKYISGSSEIVFLDCCETRDNDGSKIFLLSTYSECGGLPLGVIVTSSDSTELLASGFELLRNIVGSDIFGGKVDGPAIFLTDDSISQTGALQHVWSKSKTLLGSFYVLRSVLKWLIRVKNNIPTNKQHQFFNEFREILYARTVLECIKKYRIAADSASEHLNYLEYFNYYWDRRELWAVSYRNSSLISKNQIYNFSETTMKYLKEKVFERARAFNVIQMVDFLLTKFMEYYKKKLLDASHNHLTKNILGRPVKTPPASVMENVKQLSETTVLVPAENKKKSLYRVNTEVLLCTCVQGVIGHICQHIDWAYLMVNSNKCSSSSIDNAATRKMYYKVATGTEQNAGKLLPLYVKEAENKVWLSNSAIFIVPAPTNIITPTKAINKMEVEYEVNNAEQACLILEGRKLMDEISNSIMRFLETSPEEVVPALKMLNANCSSFETVSEFVSSCQGFGKDLHQKRSDLVNAFQVTSIRNQRTGICVNDNTHNGQPNILAEGSKMDMSTLPKNSKTIF